MVSKGRISDPAVSRLTGLRWTIYVWIGIGLLIVGSLIGYGYFTGDRVHAQDSPLLNTINEIKLEAAATRFWIEEVVDGERTFDDELSWSYLENAVLYLKSTFESERQSSAGLIGGGYVDIGASLERLSAALKGWKDLTRRIVDTPQLHPRSDFRGKLEGISSDFLEALAAIETELLAGLEMRKKRFRSIQAALIGTCIVLAVAVAVAARRYERQKSVNIIKLTEANRLLRQEITRREAVEGTLAESERLFRKIFNESPVSIIIALLEDLRVVDVNEWFVSSTGFDKQHLIARPLSDVVVCSELAASDAFRQRVVNQKHLRNMECRLPVKEGPNRIALLSSTLVEINGRTHLLLAARDITEAKAAEQVICRSEQKFRSLFESAPDFILLLDPQGSILLANPAACKRMGFAAEEIVGRHLTDFLIAESGARFTAQLPGLLARGELRAEYDIVARTGALIPVDCSATVADDGSGGCYIVLFQKDITERRSNELKFEAVHRFLIAANRHQQLRSMLDDFLNIIEDATECEAAAVRVEDEGLQQPYLAAKGFDLSSCPASLGPESRLCAQILNGKIDRGQSGYTAYGSFFCNGVSCDLGIEAGDSVCPVHRVCGRPSFESFALIPIAGPHGPVGLIHIAYREKNKVSEETVDLLEAAAMQLGTAIQRVRAEEALKDSHAELERKVQERTEQLSSINERLKDEIRERALTERSLLQHQERLRKLSSVLVQSEERERRRIAAAIHDGVGQTLAAAKIKLGALKLHFGPELWDGQLGDVSGLITLAIEEARSLTFELSPPILYEIGLQSALEWMAERFQRKFGLPISIEGDGSDRELCIPHRVLAFQSVRELCFNAVKHARATRIDVHVCRAEADCMRIEVSDDGIGIGANHQRRSGGEMGFGLFSIREQLRHHGGTFTLESLPGKGTRATLHLPLAVPAETRGDSVRHD
jgi:PAS domain S-box-containing protein